MFESASRLDLIVLGCSLWVFTTPVTRESSVSFTNAESAPQSSHTVQNQACCKCAYTADVACS